jgi:hypothetical protein
MEATTTGFKTVIPAQAGIKSRKLTRIPLDPRLRGDDIDWFWICDVSPQIAQINADFSESQRYLGHEAVC